MKTKMKMKRGRHTGRMADKEMIEERERERERE